MTIAQNILSAIGKERVSFDDLGPYDEHHVGGRQATLAVLDKMEIGAGMALLDAGCGIGGAARVAAACFGARVMGFDRDAGYIAAARELSLRSNPGELTQFVVGDALQIPVAAESFDRAYGFHVGMNIADKVAWAAELFRVVRRNGRVGLYDIFRSGPGDVHYPMPWARREADSFLCSMREMAGYMEQAGFHPVYEEDRQAYARTVLGKLVQTPSLMVPQSVSMGADFSGRVMNLHRAVEGGILAPAIMIFVKL